jgi:hypothetical protein
VNWRRVAAPAAALIVGIGATAAFGWAVLPGDEPSMAACATEDSDGPCYWDAAKRGNGDGVSFTVTADGVTHYWVTRGDVVRATP